MTSAPVARGIGGTLPSPDLLASQPEYKIFVRDAAWKRQAEVRRWISARLTLRFNDIGTMTLRVARDSTEGRRITRLSGLIVTRDGAVIFSGSVRKYARTQHELEVTVYDDLALLLTAARPTPSMATADPLTGQYPDAMYVDSGVASTVLIQFVSRQVGPAAPVPWRNNGLAFAPDPFLGSGAPPSTLRVPPGPMLDAMRFLAAGDLAGGLRFTITQSDTEAQQIVFRVSAPTDRRDRVKFSTALNTALDFEDVWQLPEANYFLVGGSGLDEARIFAEGGDADSIAEVGRLAVFVNASGIDDRDELEEKLSEYVAGVVTTRQVTVEPFEIPTLVFGVDYDMGDLVTFAVASTDDGGNETFEEFADVVREVSIELFPERGAVAVPMLGTDGASNDDAIAIHMAAVERRVGGLEAVSHIPPAGILLSMMAADSVGTAQVLDQTITGAKLKSIDTRANNEVPVYDAASGSFKWWTLGELGAVASFTSLTATGNVALGDNAGADTLAVTAATTLNGTLSAKANVTIQNSALTVLAAFDVTAGAQKATLGVSSAPGLYVDVAAGKTMIGTATALTSAADDKFTVVGGTSYFAGNSGPAIGIRWNAGQSVGWRIGVSGSGANADLQFLDDGGVAVAKFGDAGSSLQFILTGNGSASRLVVADTAFTGSEKLRVNGAVLLNGALTVSTGGIIVSATGINVTGLGTFNTDIVLYGTLTMYTGNIDVQGGTAGQVRVGFATIGGASMSGSEKLRVASGTTRLEGTVNVTTGGITVVGGTTSDTFTANGTGAPFTFSGGSQTQTTVGASSVASAPPAKPAGYLKILFTGGVSRVIPYYLP